ncbi:hypothetical protein [Weissella confusa]|uniref:hypothetical protein n=1 Tax=Weissella confusa TaxID=1583 RepID=UPI0022E160FF|nr:hypothetical protein [Weissella confusa]
MDKSVYTHNEYQQLINKLNEVTTAKRFWWGAVWRRSSRVIGAVIIAKVLLVFLSLLDTHRNLTSFIQVVNMTCTFMLWLLPVTIASWCWLFYKAKTALRSLNNYWATHEDNQLVFNEFDNVNRYQLMIEFSDVFAGWRKKGGWQIVRFEDVAQPYKTFWRVRHSYSWAFYIAKHGVHLSRHISQR